MRVGVLALGRLLDHADFHVADLGGEREEVVGRRLVRGSPGSQPAMTPRRSALSSTVRVSGPAASVDQLTGTQPKRRSRT